MSKLITIHPQYFLKEGFGTLMSHYATMYCLYKDLQFIPAILNIDFKSQKLESAMEAFNKFDESIIYHNETFINFSKIFTILDSYKINNYNWELIDLSNLNYNEIINVLKNNTNNICCFWSLHSNFYQKYLDEIINILYIFNDNIIQYSKDCLPYKDKDFVAVCVRNEYKKSNYPHTRLSLDFYKKSMEQFDVNNTKYLIFSDDIDESKNMFHNLHNYFDIYYTNPMQSAIGLCAMSLCDHIICANSSFSYWAALLNKNPNKKIICSPYFIDNTRNTELANLLNFKWYPSSWIPIDIK